MCVYLKLNTDFFVSSLLPQHFNKPSLLNKLLKKKLNLLLLLTILTILKQGGKHSKSAVGLSFQAILDLGS